MTPKNKRLTIELSEEVHHKIKTLALKRNITIREYVLKGMMNMINWEQKYDKEKSEE